MKFLVLLIVSILLLPYSNANSQNVLTGLDQVNDYLSWFKGKRIGIIANHTSVNRDGKHAAQVFKEMDGCTLSALFGPEHGFIGKHSAGEKIENSGFSYNSIPIYSLYGKNLKPTKEMMDKVDLLVFDIQDIGTRFYTYIWTMALAIEAAAENSKEIIILDRPNPLSGFITEGNIPDKRFASFVGLHPVPVRYGLTCGELASLINSNGWLKNSVRADLRIIPLKNWKRSMWYNETGLKFIKPSPNIPSLETAIVYPGLCLLEGTNLSEGRGTYKPFMQFGAPWINGDSLSIALNNLKIEGIKFSPVTFKPVSIDTMSKYPKYQNEICNGCVIEITDRDIIKSWITGLMIVKTIYNIYPTKFKWRTRHFDRLCGTDIFRKEIESHSNLDLIIKSQQSELLQFNKLREKYFLYP